MRLAAYYNKSTTTTKQFIMGQLFSTASPMVEITNSRYGWKRGRGDPRDLWHQFQTGGEGATGSPDLRSQCPQVYDQGQLGSCTANAIAACYEFGLLRQKLTNFNPSRLFIYYNERDMEGHVGEDSGAEIRDGIKSLHTQGVCPEWQWPYDIQKFADKPSPECYVAAKGDHSIEYRRVVQTKEQLIACLNSGFPIAFGFVVYESFEGADVARTGQMPMPQAGEKVLGGHAVVVVGYLEERQCFVVRNSWGPEWGDAGYFYMPEAFLLDPSQCSDLWTVTLVTEVQEN